MPITSRFVVRSAITLLAVGFIALLAIVGTTIWLGERAQNYSDDATEVRTTRQAAVELRDAIRTAESSQRGYLITGNEIYLAPFDSAKSMSFRQLSILNRALASDSDARAMLVRLNEVIAGKLREMDQSVLLKSNRRDTDALTLFRTNRGKSLMDETNVYLSSIILSADDRLTVGIFEQKSNARMLRWVSIIAAIVIVLVLGIVAVTVTRYTREIAKARDEVRLVNAGLEQRVAERTTDLSRARDRAQLLLAEVNHRVANSLTMVASLVQLQANALAEPAAKDALAETKARIYAIALVHQKLYGGGDVGIVALDEYLAALLGHMQASMLAEGHGVSLRHSLQPLRLSTDSSINLAVIVTEWVTNAFKYAYPDKPGEVRVNLKVNEDGSAELNVEDDGVGRREGAVIGTGLGTRIVGAMARSLNAEVEYIKRLPGTQARIVFPVVKS